MTSFKFPPPPPPPPKASSDDAQNSYASQRGGFPNVRSGRGRGRGGPGQGRGGNNIQGGSRGGPRGAHQQHGRGGFQNRNSGQGKYQQQYQQPPQQAIPTPNVPAIPSSTYSNPLFGNMPAVGPQASPVNPAAFAQAMAFMSTPAGMQSMAAFANHMAGGVAPQQCLQSPPPPSQQPWSQQYQSPPPQGNGRKRKRNERVPGWQTKQNQPSTQNTQHQGQKPPRAKAVPPPAIPSFGFSLPQASTPQVHPTSKAVGKNKKQGVNLGLTYREEEDPESSDGEDVDEEATFASDVKVEGIMFEHEGERISLQTPAEVAAWIKDRRRKYPTKERVAEKAEELATKRASELDFLRKIKERMGNKPAGTQHVSIPKPALTEASASLETQQPDLKELRNEVQESSTRKESVPSSLKNTQAEMTNTKPNAIDLGLGYASDTDSDGDESSVLSDSSVISSSDESSDDGSGSDDDDSDPPPEQSSSRAAPKPIVPPPPAPARVLKEPKKKQPTTCFRWKQFGKCKFGNKCEFQHPPREENRRMGLYEKMVEQELEKADRLALDAIKYLGRQGFLG